MDVKDAGIVTHFSNITAIKDIEQKILNNPGPDKAGLEKLSKAELIAMILGQHDDTRIQLAEKNRQITELTAGSCSGRYRPHRQYVS